MKKIFIILVITGIILSLTGISQARPTGQPIRPIPATDVKIVKKVFLPLEKGEPKGRPIPPPGQDKQKNGKDEGPAATGALGSISTGIKYAVVIGICDYPGAKYDIGDCISDGDSLNMYDALVSLYGYNPGNISLFRDSEPVTGVTPWGNPFESEPATYDAIWNAVNAIKGKVAKGDEVVFFFSGHGADGIAQDSDNENRDEAIVVGNSYDEDGNKLVDYIWDGDLRDYWFNSFGTSRIIFIFDSCLAGGMNDVEDKGRVVSMGTNETQPAYVYSEVNENGVGEGVFTHYFVNEGMISGNANIHDYDGDATLYESVQVTVEEAFDYAKEIIPSVWKRQKPTISDKFDDDLLL